MDFKTALAELLKHEGGYVHDPDDNGGETFRGVSRRSWPDWIGWAAVDAAKAAGNTTDYYIDAWFADDPEMARDVASLYYRHFWCPVERLGAPARVTAKLFNAAVNIGLKRAVMFAQGILLDLGRPLGLIDLLIDGDIGPRTQGAARLVFGSASGEEAFLQYFVARQTAYYVVLAQKPGQAKFLNGWKRRAKWLP